MTLLTRIEKKSILVIGDVMMDIYYNGDVKRISPEAPVPVFRKITERSSLGGASNVAANLIAADQDVSIMSIVGNDSAGVALKEKMDNCGINTDLLFFLERKTTVKTRFLAENNQQVLRLDVEDSDEIDDGECEKLLVALEEKIIGFEGILISDYLKGLLSFSFTQGVLRLAKKYNVPVIIDVKDSRVDKYKGAYLLKPNLNEIRSMTGLPARTDEEIIEASNSLRGTCNCKYVLTTCGARGMVLVGDGEPFFINSVVKEVFDVTGAGDTTIAYLVACMVNGSLIRDAVKIANYAAGIQVSKVGTSSVYWHEIRETYADKKERMHKLLDSESIHAFRKEHEKQKIVFTNGCFDILHVGHVRYLREAAKLGDILVIGLNSDSSVKRLKGPERPINSEIDRAELLCALGFVDYVAIFEDGTPYNLISEIKPDVLVKGRDYPLDQVVGKDIVESRGGKVVLLPFVPGKSTTNIVNHIKGKYDNSKLREV